MRTFNRSRIVSALLGAGICLSVAALAQSQEASSQQSASQDSSVADAARRSRDKKKNPSASSKVPKVITDDDLAQRYFQPGPDVLNVGASSRPATESPESAGSAQAGESAAEQEAEIAKLKPQVAEAEKDLDLARRQLTLDQDTHFANPEYARDLAGKAKLDAEKQQIDDKQQELDKLKTRLAVLESQRKPGGAQAAPPPQPEKAPSGGNPAQTEKPPQTGNSPSASPQQ
jgi:uncharacterized coiled-coil protein SlyX